jgi:hypothetical protein
LNEIGTIGLHQLVELLDALLFVGHIGRGFVRDGLAGAVHQIDAAELEFERGEHALRTTTILVLGREPVVHRIEDIGAGCIRPDARVQLTGKRQR